jgi:hypothetical protein
MAITIKEASNTPLAIAQLAESLSNTYLQHTQNDTKRAQWEQEATWRNEKQERSDAAGTSMMNLDPSMFTGGEAGRMNAANLARDNKDASGFFASSTAPDAWDKTYQANIRVGMDHYGDPELARQYADRVTGGDVSRTQDVTGMGTRFDLESAAGLGGRGPTLGTSGTTTGDPGKWQQQYAPPGGDGSTTIGAPESSNATMTGSAAAGAYTTKAGDVWTNAEVQKIAQQKGISVQQALKIIKDNDI